MSSPKISIIVPVYNVEEFLSQCLDSLTRQTYDNIEIICVNDGSPDKSGEILEHYRKKDGRIRVITKENGGLSAARNDGLNAAGGEYVMFVDSDDWIDLDMCSVMYEALAKDKADSCMCCYVKEFGGHSAVEHIYSGDIVFEGRKLEEGFYRRLFGPAGEELKNPAKYESVVSACMQLFKAEMVKNVEFIDTKLIGTEDLMFQIYAYKACKKLVYLDKPMYHYRKTNSSSLTSTHKPNLCEQRERMFSMIEDFIEENNLPPEYSNALSNRAAMSMIGIGLNECAADKSIFKKSERIKKALKASRMENAFSQLDFEYFPFHWRVFFTLCRLRLSFLLIIMLNAISFLRKRI